MKTQLITLSLLFLGLTARHSSPILAGKLTGIKWEDLQSNSESNRKLKTNGKYGSTEDCSHGILAKIDVNAGRDLN